MLRFTMNAKELNALLEKAASVADKSEKNVSTFLTIKTNEDEEHKVVILGSNIIDDHYMRVSSSSARDVMSGEARISVSDIKAMKKMVGDVTVEDTSTDQRSILSVRNGKKLVNIPKYSNDELVVPDVYSKMPILNVNEAWLFDTVTKLDTYTDNKGINGIMQVFNFNLKAKRVEALDGYKIGMRVLDDRAITEKAVTEGITSIMLHNKCVPVFKKVLDKKSDHTVTMYQNDKYVKVEGKDFSYIAKRVEGQYFKVEQMLTGARSYSFIADRKKLLDVMKYNYDMGCRGAERYCSRPVVLHAKDGKLYSYAQTLKYDLFDELETKDVVMDDNFFIGFNPTYLIDAFSIVDVDGPVCYGTNNNSPLFVEGKEYRFAVLPMITGDEIIENMKNFVQKVAS